MTNEELCLEIQKGNNSLTNELIIQNMDFIKATANLLYESKLYNDRYVGIEIDDLIQEGCIKFIQAAHEFDISQGYTFLTYAGTLIQNEMIDHIRKAKNSFEGHLSYDYDYEYAEVCLDEQISSDDGRNTLADQICDKYSAIPEEFVIKKFTYLDLYNAIKNCSERHRKFIYYHYGFLDGVGHSLDESAVKFQVPIYRIKELSKASLICFSYNYEHI